MTTANATPNIDDATLRHIQEWQGRSEISRDIIGAAPVRGLLATLDRDTPEPVTGVPLPTLWHWLYFLPHAKQMELGTDGHPRRGGFLPPVPLPRRMWAGGRFVWTRPLKIGQSATRVSAIDSIRHKYGGSGDLVFVTVRHEVSNEEGLCLTEEHDIVYRGEPQPGQSSAAPIVASQEAPWERKIVPDDVMLFRYSALTFNGHRIHYDRRYVTEVEHYPGLIVHGPLIATLLMDLVHRNAPEKSISRFEFRAIRPTFDGTPLYLRGKPSEDNQVELWASDHEGYVTMQAKACFAEAT